MRPTDDQLRRFLLGELSAGEAERVAEWVESDPAAVEVLAGLDPPDPLIDALADRGGSTSDATRPADTLPELPAPPAPVPGYRFVRELGRGGMGVVFEAEDERLRRRVAVKVMRADVAARAGAKERFVREARALAAVESEFLVPVFQVGEAADGTPFLVMPLLAGESLDARLQRGPLSADELGQVAADALRGLAAAHARGLVHRDVKPSNLWLEAGDGGRVRRVRVLDFGLARPVGRAGELTGPQQVVGSVHYMAPEQARGADVDGRADLFGLGATLYHAATGVRPFAGDSVAAVLTALAVDDPPPVRSLVPAVSPRLAALIHRLLAKKADDRPPSAEAALADAPAARPRPAVAWVGLAVAAVVLVAVAAAAVFLFTRGGGPLAAGSGGSGNEDDDWFKRYGTTKGRPSAFGPAELPKPKPVVHPLPVFGPAPVVKAGAPLGPNVLTPSPAPLPGVVSWTVETVLARSGVEAVALSADGERLAALGSDDVVRVYAVKDDKFLAARLLPAGDGSYSALRWNAAGDRLLVSNPTSVTVIPWPGGAMTRLAWVEDGPGRWNNGQRAVSPDGGTVAETTNESVRLFDLTTGKLAKDIPTTTRLKAGEPSPRHIAWSTTGDCLVVSTPPTLSTTGGTPRTDPAFEVIDVAKGESVRSFRPAGSGAIFPTVEAATAGGRRIAYSVGGTVNVWEDGTAKAVPLFGDWVQFTPSGDALLGRSSKRRGERALARVDLTNPAAIPTAKDVFGAVSGPVSFAGTRAAYLTGSPFEEGATSVTLTDDAFDKRRVVRLSLAFDLDRTADGHYAAHRNHADQIVYLLQTAAGQESLTPAEFEKRTGWKNDPAKARPPK